MKASSSTLYILPIRGSSEEFVCKCLRAVLFVSPILNERIDIRKPHLGTLVDIRFGLEVSCGKK